MRRAWPLAACVPSSVAMVFFASFVRCWRRLGSCARLFFVPQRADCDLRAFGVALRFAPALAFQCGSLACSDGCAGLAWRPGLRARLARALLARFRVACAVASWRSFWRSFGDRIAGFLAALRAPRLSAGPASSPRRLDAPLDLRSAQDGCASPAHAPRQLARQISFIIRPTGSVDAGAGDLAPTPNRRRSTARTLSSSPQYSPCTRRYHAPSRATCPPNALGARAAVKLPTCRATLSRGAAPPPRRAFRSFAQLSPRSS